ncbi:hypothetical protein FK220_007480 [Flavobacteriaceae bacterium TP-CH-4]|uniref:Aerotolerance regulator N-terminal domain-containing protein n=1 Tax=Pelagihabitans pacificus TaxID=2696054 RepID=A0A967E621_9FLAO|nr:BatA domain-containing protein [Pelagihabitans pacificus]NHF59175.1 hypothetical protein [Pelagihabitans pacificus]
MQFKYPELLWALLLLLIPIFIHLFQLRKFQKTPFTNVKFLKKVVAESRRSNTLKKWLLLLTRLLLLTGLVLAFAQPFFAEKSALREKEIIVYLDDSFSMQAKKEGTPLLDDAIQTLIRSVPKDQRFTLFTNEQVFRDVTIEGIQNQLLAVSYSSKQLNLEEIFLKGSTFFSQDAATEKNLIVLSDFQTRIASSKTDSLIGTITHLVKMTPDKRDNVSLDSAFIATTTAGNKELTALLSANGAIESTPVSLFNNDTLIAKTSAGFNDEGKATVNFTLPENERVNGKLTISDNGLSYDNQLYFNLDRKEKINALSIGSADATYLRRIFTDDEFQFDNFPLSNLNYSDLALQNLIVLNELERIPTSLITNLKSFTESGGHLVVIPADNCDLPTYNALLSGYFSTNLVQKISAEQDITNISFSHPLYRDVFEKQVSNFQYPKVSQYYGIRTNAPKLLAFQDKSPFLVGNDGVYIFTGSIAPKNSNFINSPLIVPTFYNMGINSLKLPVIYSVLGEQVNLDISTVLAKDHILKVTKEGYEFIPRQQSMPNKVTLTFDGSLNEDGIYNIKDDDRILRNLSFNHQRKESVLTYLATDQLQGSSNSPSITALFEEMEKDNRITELWKWFVILALSMLFVEILIQKLIR